MDVGILGLAGSGKTTLFSLLTANARALVASGHRSQGTVGIGRVPDPRLESLSDLYRPQKKTPAVVRYVDVPGVATEHRLQSSLNIPELRTMDALMVVLRAFEDSAVPHPLGSVNPWRDLERIGDELALADQVVVESRLERLEREATKRRTPELEEEKELLRRCLSLLDAGRPLRTEHFTAAESERLRGFAFLSGKPVLAVINVDEESIGLDPKADPRWRAWLEEGRCAATAVCAKLEQEISELDADDAAAFATELGITESALGRIARESYRLLGLISFFTVGEDECRAWSIHRDTPAVEAAAAIHSDISRGFIRAEVVPCNDLLAAGSLSACRERGTLRLEGKTYPVQDGDVVHYRFNV